ncbi:hemolysin family protein [Parvularcula dongshanensis]|uniref:CBS domain containing-hemolysin-like protein n=1 Tax=Parvularcula dongshanensis TaxID=1173995 RepID=A0A840HYT5_9PROT|nr:hemolysin family protein [Parvularcula dongshanensis]MBB4658006.1 CBS domain containing-hemolysin-like protein [Parvularcula dongshanensis]
MPDGAAPSLQADQASAQDGPPRQTNAAPAGQEAERGPLGKLLFWRRPAREAGLGGMLQEGSGTSLTDAERQMIERIVAFDTKRVDDVAIPRADIVGVAADADLPSLLTTFAEAGHSRLPVYRGDLDDPVGMVHIKDLVGLLADPERGEAEGRPAPDRPILAGLTRRVLYVPPSMPITDLLLRMQAQRVHMALVIDEFGGTDGLVTIEDLIEEIVGDIRDEHDEPEELSLSQVTGGRWDADARLELGDIAEKTGLDLTLEDHEADTLGGLVFSLAGRIPLRGEVLSHPEGVELEVADADPRRIRRIIIRTRKPRPKEAARPDPAQATDI